MFRYMRSRLSDERGVAVVVAILVSMVVVTLGVTSVSLSIHQSDQSAQDRRRVQGVAAAEAGINWYFSHIQSVTAASQLQCQKDQTLPSTPAASFHAEVLFYDAAGDTIADCPPVSETPVTALITSTGTTGAVNSPERTMQSLVQLTQVAGGGIFDGAIYSEESTAFGAEVIVNGDGAANGNVYTNGLAKIKAESSISGDVWAQGPIEMDANSQVDGDIWATGEIKQGAETTVYGDATSAYRIHLSRDAHTYGDAQATETIALDSGAVIDGLILPYTPTEGPPVRTFPTFTYNASDWTAAGYTINTFTSCSSAKSFIDNISSGDHVVRVVAACNMAWPADATINVRGNLAIISDDGFSMGAEAKIVNVGAPHTLHLIFGLVKCGEIKLSSESTIGDGISTLLYSTCLVEAKAESFVVKGQIIGGKVKFDREAAINYTPVPLPGVTGGGFEEDVVYIREVVNPA